MTSPSRTEKSIAKETGKTAAVASTTTTYPTALPHTAEQETLIQEDTPSPRGANQNTTMKFPEVTTSMLIEAIRSGSSVVVSEYKVSTDAIIEIAAAAAGKGHLTIKNITNMDEETMKKISTAGGANVTFDFE